MHIMILNFKRRPLPDDDDDVELGEEFVDRFGFLDDEEYTDDEEDI